jgi:hypothetical protein
MSKLPPSVRPVLAQSFNSQAHLLPLEDYIASHDSIGGFIRSALDTYSDAALKSVCSISVTVAQKMLIGSAHTCNCLDLANIRHSIECGFALQRRQLWGC